MQLEADRFANNRWADEEFVKELEVVKEERRMRTEDNTPCPCCTSNAVGRSAFSASPVPPTHRGLDEKIWMR